MHSTIDDRKKELINGLVQARLEVMDAILGVPEDRVDEVFLGTWSIRDLVAHLEGWDYTNLQAVQEILGWKYPSFFQFFDKDWGSYNSHLVDQYKRPALEELLEDLRISHQRLVDFLDSLPAHDIVEGKAKRENGRSVTIRNLLKAEARDEEKHVQEKFCLQFTPAR